MIIAYSTLRHTFDHLYPIVEALRDRGHDARIVSSWAGAEWANHVMKPEDVMALDATFVVASASDALSLAPRDVVYVERGSGQTYDGDVRTAGSASYSSGTIPNAVLFLCPNRFVAARRQRIMPTRLAVVTGAPKLDEYFHLRGFHDGVHRQMVAFAFGWVRKDKPDVCPETRGAFEYWQPSLKKLALGLRRMGMFPVMTAHPRSAKRVQYHAERSGFEWMPSADVLRCAGQLWFDNTSLGYEFAAIGRPVGVLDAPWYRREVSHGLRFWECIPGPEAVDIDDVLELSEYQRHEDPWVSSRSCAADLYERFDGHAADRCAEAIEVLAAVSA